jgi:transcriptional regulator with XRE-family HTH domain
MHEFEVQVDVARVLRLLTMIVAGSGRRRPALERALGLGAGQLAELLRGETDLRLSQLLALLGTLGVKPGEFFGQCVPEVPGRQPESDLLRAATTPTPGPPALPPTPLPREAADFDGAVARALVRLLGGAAPG